MTALLPWQARWINLRCAVLTFTTGRHHYFGTLCMHQDHGYCASHTGLSGAKRPARCKRCAAPCECFCHAPVDASDE